YFSSCLLPSFHHAKSDHEMEKRQAVPLLGPLRLGQGPLAHRRAALPGPSAARHGADPCPVHLRSPTRGDARTPHRSAPRVWRVGPVVFPGPGVGAYRSDQCPCPPRSARAADHYLVLAAINRAAWPKSKRAFAEWYQGTVLARLVPALPDELRSQRFWDHMDLFAPEHFAPIQRELLGRIHARFPLGAQFLVYDTTNYYTFIHTFNSRPSLPQRGKNKQKRADLRQLSLALVVDEAQGLPLYYRCYEGNVTDVVALGASLQEMVGQFLPQTA